MSSATEDWLGLALN